MNRSYFALFVALLIHLLLVIFFIFLGTLSKDIKKPIKENKIRVSLKELPTPKKISGEIKKEPIVTPEAPPMPKGEQLKEIIKTPIKKPPVVFKPKAKVKKP